MKKENDHKKDDHKIINKEKQRKKYRNSKKYETGLRSPIKNLLVGFCFINMCIAYNTSTTTETSVGNNDDFSILSILKLHTAKRSLVLCKWRMSMGLDQNLFFKIQIS